MIFALSLHHEEKHMQSSHPIKKKSAQNHKSCRTAGVCYECTIHQLLLTLSDSYLTESNAMSPQLQPHTFFYTIN